MKNSPHSQLKHTNKIRPLTLKPSKGQYAFRIGFLGDRIDRFDRDLLGKILEQKSFNQRTQQHNSGFDGNPDAKWLLSTPLTGMYTTDRHRIVAATLSEFGNWDTKWQLKQAVEWLKSKEVQLIFFQHKWMLASELQSVFDKPVKQHFSTLATA